MFKLIQYKDNRGINNCDLFLACEADIMQAKYSRLGYIILAVIAYDSIVAAQSDQNHIRQYGYRA